MAAAGMLKGRVVVALYTYQGSEFGDMTFSKGDQMEIVDDTDPDWCGLLHSLIVLHSQKFPEMIRLRLLVITLEFPSQVGCKAHNKWGDGTHTKVTSSLFFFPRVFSFTFYLLSYCRNYVALLSSIESEEWYCGKISRRTAEEYLMGHINARGTFLIRYDSVCAPAHPDV